MIQPDQIRSYFSQLGLSPEIADLYLALHRHGAQSIAELARTSEVERTRIYRLLDELGRSGLVEVETDSKRHLFRAAPITNLRVLISQKEQELRSLQAGLPVVEAAFSPGSYNSPTTRVQFYRGPEGVKQMYWNTTRSSTDIVSILYENMQIRTKSAFFERWVRRCNEQNLRFRSLFGDEFVASQRAWYAKRQNERLAHWQGRYLPAAIFPITHSLVVYNNVTAYQHWQANEVFGIEIYNQQIADAQRAFFELLWPQATPRADV